MVVDLCSRCHYLSHHLQRALLGIRHRCLIQRCLSSQRESPGQVYASSCLNKAVYSSILIKRFPPIHRPCRRLFSSYLAALCLSSFCRASASCYSAGSFPIHLDQCHLQPTLSPTSSPNNSPFLSSSARIEHEAPEATPLGSRSTRLEAEVIHKKHPVTRPRG